jgi:hypothetical protein
MHHGGAGGDSPHARPRAASSEWPHLPEVSYHSAGRKRRKAGKCLTRRIIYASTVAITDPLNGSDGQA